MSHSILNRTIETKESVFSARAVTEWLSTCQIVWDEIPMALIRKCGIPVERVAEIHVRFERRRITVKPISVVVARIPSHLRPGLIINHWVT